MSKKYGYIFPSIIFLILLVNLLPSGHSSVNFKEATSYYTISGELCYEEVGFVQSYAVNGEMMVTLKRISSETVECNYWYYVNRSGSNLTIKDSSGLILIINRRQVDGNYTSFYIDFPTQPIVSIYNFYESVEANYLGERFICFGNQYIKTHYFCYSKSDLQNVLRFEWFFEWDTGILLCFIKSIEINFIRVQWMEYLIKNTTVPLSIGHPVTVLFANFRESFFGVVGASVLVAFLFLYLVNKKSQRGDLL